MSEEMTSGELQEALMLLRNFTVTSGLTLRKGKHFSWKDIVKALRAHITELEKEPLRDVGIQEVCEWMVREYPPDVFTGFSGERGSILTAEMRDKAAEILKFRKEAAERPKE